MLMMTSQILKSMDFTVGFGIIFIATGNLFKVKIKAHIYSIFSCYGNARLSNYFKNLHDYKYTRETLDLVTFNGEIINGKLRFL